MQSTCGYSFWWWGQNHRLDTSWNIIYWESWSVDFCTGLQSFSSSIFECTPLPSSLVALKVYSDVESDTNAQAYHEEWKLMMFRAAKDVGVNQIQKCVYQSQLPAPDSSTRHWKPAQYATKSSDMCESNYSHENCENGQHWRKQIECEVAMTYQTTYSILSKLQSSPWEVRESWGYGWTHL